MRSVGSPSVAFPIDAEASDGMDSPIQQGSGVDHGRVEQDPSQPVGFLAGFPPLIRQGFCFCLVGGVNTLVDLTVLNVLIWFQPAGRSGWLYSVFKTLAFLVAVTNSYFLNHRFTFQSERQKSAQQMSHYLMVSVVGLLINVGIASTVATLMVPPQVLLPYWPSIAALCGIPFGMVWNFVGYRLFVF